MLSKLPKCLLVHIFNNLDSVDLRAAYQVEPELRQFLIDHNLRRENNLRRNHDYLVGDYVFEALKDGGKLDPSNRGPL